jgi:nicotinate-nucleotide adenylyltransferase
MGAALGVLGGAFNPPHVGHLLLAQEAGWQLELERVLLMTTGVPPHKAIADDPGAPKRLELTKLAAEAGEAVEASSLEVERDGPSFTYRTLELLSEREPERELVLLMGADMAASLEAWREPERIVELSRIGVVPREGIEMDQVRATLERLGAADRMEIIEMPVCGVSSTLIRERAAAGRPLRHLVPEPVARVIAAEGLYR